MHIAILGATSQIAKDLIQSFSGLGELRLTLFARCPQTVVAWMKSHDIDKDWIISGYEHFSTQENFDAIINFVGVGDPALAAAMGASIFDITRQYDDLAIDYLKVHPNCRYIFLSSGAAYGSKFDKPADESTVARIPINNLQPQDWYGVAKLHAECRHRSLVTLPIVDIRVFNYISHSQNMYARFLIADIIRAIRYNTVLKTSSDYIVRDFMGPTDFFQLVNAIISVSATNDVVDCYSKASVDKPSLMKAMQAQFGLQYETISNHASINATGSKPYYYSLNRRAANFGYVPSHTSLKNIEEAVKLVLLKIHPGVQ